MEKKLSYDFMLPLKEIALRRMSIVLWNQSDVLTSIGKFQYALLNEIKWRETVEGKVVNKLAELQLPNSITQQMMQILKPIGSQIMRWKLFHASFLSDSNMDLDVPILEKLCYTPAGTVDYRKTAEALVRSDVVDAVKRYKLACLYCLEDYIPEFWKELPKNLKKYFYNVKDTTLIEEPRLWFCWPYILKGEESKLDCVCGSRSYESQTTFRQYAFEYLAITGNKAAVEYFLRRLTHEERKVSLIRAAHGIIAHGSMEMYSYPDAFPKEKGYEILRYLLSLMTSEQQMQIFKEKPREVLRCFLKWPWQDLFLDIADVIWTFLPQTDYNYLLSMMTKSIRNSGYYFPNLFQNFFMRSPLDFRKHFVNEDCRAGEIFREIFNSEDTNTIKVIFRNVDATDRVRLVTSQHILKLFHKYILEDRWPVVDVCLREATLLKEDKERLKEDFMEFHRDTEWGTPEWKRFFEFFNETDANTQSKRCLEDETFVEVYNSSVKKKKNL